MKMGMERAGKGGRGRGVRLYWTAAPEGLALRPHGALPLLEEELAGG
jgi:hypothetical protein